MEKVIQQQAEEQARQLERMRGRFNELMANAYERAIEYMEDDSFVEQLRPADVVQILRLHLDTTLKLSEPRSEAHYSVVDWSEHEQRELDAILDEIDAEEAHEEREAGSDGGEEDPEDNEGDSA
jgi:antitoxin component of MazEF toxin-antitoxin module